MAELKPCRQLCPWNTLYGCKKPEHEPCILSNMPCESFEQKPQTNADHIRSMTDEELAEFLCGIYDDENCGVYQDECGKFICGTTILDYDQYKIADWLKQPYEEDLI